MYLYSLLKITVLNALGMLLGFYMVEGGILDIYYAYL